MNRPTSALLQLCYISIKMTYYIEKMFCACLLDMEEFKHIDEKMYIETVLISSHWKKTQLIDNRNIINKTKQNEV